MKKLLALISVLGIMIFSLSPSIFADNIVNNLDASIDATAESLSFALGSVDQTIGLFVNPTNGDGKSGCNLTGSTTLVVSVNSSDSSKVTVSPSSLTFTSCGSTPSLTVHGVAVGTSTISLSQVTNTTAGTFSLSPATFNVTVTAPIPADSTPPSISPTLTPPANVNGWNNTDVLVSWDVTDPDSVIDSMSGCDPVTLTDETSGTDVTCSATSQGGNASQTVTVKIDKTNPVIAGSANPAPNSNGWNNTDVLVSFSCADSGAVQSGIDISSVTGDTLSAEAASQSVTNTGICTDKAGNAAEPVTVSGINIDKTAPTITINAPVDGAHYTFHQVVNADWSVLDLLSGLDGLPVATTASGSPINTSSTGVKNYTVSANDLAGNNATQTVSYTVDPYLFSNFLVPLNLDSKTYKQNSTIPVKFQLKDITNTFVSTAVARLTVDGSNALPSGGSNTGNLFRYDLSANQYIFNLSTKQLTKGTHLLAVLLDDGTTHTIAVIIK